MNSGIKILLCALALAAGAQIKAQPALDSLETVVMPFGKEQSRISMTGSSYTVTSEQIAKYPSLDLHNMLQVLFPGLDMTETSGSPAYNSYTYDTSIEFVSNNASSSLRGTRNKVITVVDDAVMPLNLLMLEPEQIESITLLTDIVDKAKYGPIGSYGILYIRTKRGHFSEKATTKVHVNLESGASFADVVPEWVDGVEYATLNNIARINSGYTPLYYNVNAYAGSSATDPKYPNVDYYSLMMKEVKPMHRASVFADGGGQNFNYVIGISGAREGGIYQSSQNDFNRVNFMSRVTTKIGRYITAGVGFLGHFSLYREPYISYTNYREVPAVAYPLTLGSFDGDAGDSGVLSREGDNIYAVSTVFGSNHYALFKDGGNQSTRTRSGVFNLSLDYDLSFLLKGLKSRTYFNYDVDQSIKLGKKNDYLAYFWTSEDGIGDLSSHKGEKASARSSSANSSYQETFFYEDLGYSFSKNGHNAAVDAIFMVADERSKHVTSYYLRHMDYLLSTNYSYKGIYNVEGQLDYDGSARFAKGKQWGFFPSAGLSWVPSEYSFVKNYLPWINRFKLWAQYGKLGLSSSVYGTGQLYESNYSISSGMTYGPTSSNRWFGTETTSSRPSSISRIANYDLSWETLRELDFGLEAKLFGGLSLGATFFDYYAEGLITEISSAVPTYYGIGSVKAYDNNDVTRYKGYELSANWVQKMGDFTLSATAMASHAKTTRVRVGSDTYVYSYSRITGRPSTVIFGYKCLGHFTSEEEIASSSLYSADTIIGDLKYDDKNDDGVINSNDQSVIGNTEPKLRYGIRLNLSYKNLFDVTVVGSGRYGVDYLANSDYFWNGWSDNNYSAFVRDNIGGDYPVLSYVKRTGNFQSSDYWIRKADFFKIQNVELGCNLPLRKENRLGLAGVRLTVRGANLLTFTSMKYVDPEAPDSGVSVAPLYRTCTIGANITF